ncbi:MAG: hypothetical protein HY721_03780 [Planctomycetes bacterium]|nr:hypothetical protein [Planctomycetota bacterium]
MRPSPAGRRPEWREDRGTVDSTFDPQAALDLQIARYREMTGEERLSLALELHELACDVAREGIRRQHPDASPAEVERLLRERLSLVRLPRPTREP